MKLSGIAAAGLLAGSLVLALFSELLPPPAVAIPCRLLPNGVVPLLAPWNADCPLDAYDRVLAKRFTGDAVELFVSRRGDEGWVRVPVLRDTISRARIRLVTSAILAVALLSIAGWIRRGSASRAAGPFFAFSACVGAVLVTALCGHRSHWLELAGVAARGAVPATLAHLALTFPREREVLRRFPRLPTATYGVAAVWIGISAVSLYRSPAVFTLIDGMLVLVSLSIWALIVIGCALASRESDSLLERARARVLLWGSLVVPGIAGLAAVAAGARPPPTALLVALPFPVGYAVLRYRLFDAGPDLRSAVSWLVYVAVVAPVILAASWLATLVPGAPSAWEDKTSFFAAALFGFLVGEPLRGRVRRRIAARVSPGAERLSERAHEHARRSTELRDPDACAELLCRAAREGLDAGGTSVFLSADGDWRLAHALGSPAPTLRRTAALAERVVCDSALAHLAREDSQPGPEARALRRDGIEVVTALRWEGRLVGLLLVTTARRVWAYDTRQLHFLESIARQAAISVQNANLTGGLVESERKKALVHAGAGLAHDLGKPLGVVECLAARLPLVLEDPAHLARSSKAISVLAAEMRSTLRRSLAPVSPSRFPELEEVLERAVRAVAPAHGSGRVALRLPPALPPFAGPAEMLTRILANLLDNALLASRDEDVVEVAVTTREGQLEFEVIDRGCGMEPSVAARAFEPFFTTRAAGSGTGLGLAICRDLVDAIGGDISLVSAPGFGTRVRVRVPRQASAEGDAI